MPTTLGRIYTMGKEGTIVHINVLEAAKQELNEKFGELQRNVEEGNAKAAEDTKATIEPLSQLATKNAADIQDLRDSSRKYTEDCVEALKQQLSQMMESMESMMTGRMDTEFEDSATRNDNLSGELKKVRLAGEGLEERLRTQRTELAREFQRGLDSVTSAHASDQERSMNEVESSLSAWKRAVHEEHVELQRRREEEVHADLMESIKSMTAEKITHKAGEVMNEIQEHLEKHDTQLANCEKTMMEEVVGHGTKLDSMLEHLRDDTERRLTLVEHDTVDLRDAVSATASFATRSIEWVIPDLLRQFSGSAQSWFSPRFSAAGENGLQLELQVSMRVPLIENASEVPRIKGSNDSELPKMKKERDPAVEKPILEAKVNLWAGSSSSAGEGTTMAFRLALSGMNGPSQEHRFERWGPCPGGRTWRLDERLSREDGSVRVLAEFLTASTSFEQLKELPSSVCRSPSPPWAAAFADKATEPQQLPELTAAAIIRAPPHKAGTICVQRTVDNRTDERMKSCMVRRIEWRLEQAAGLKALFPRGECVSSTVFSAAGMEGLQLIFYPNGCASAPSGYSSFFMHCPGEVMPKAWLHIGKHRVEAIHEDVQQGWVGRVKFWHVERSAEAETDSINLAVEVQDAPSELLQVHASNDPRRYLRKGVTGSVEVRPPSQGRPRSSSSPTKAKRRPPPPTSDSTLARSAQTTQWMSQAYVDSAQGYNARAVTPRGSERMPAITPSPPLAMQALPASA